MNSSQNKTLSFDDSLQNTIKILSSVHKVVSPFEFASTIIRAISEMFNANIVTLFRVNPDKTKLVSVETYNPYKEQTKITRSQYELDWGNGSKVPSAQQSISAWVAVTGRGLFIKDLSELLDIMKKLSTTDPKMLPGDVKKHFGCRYTVPLRISQTGDTELPTKDSVFGVLKIERKNDNSEGIFSSQQLGAIDLIAAQLTLVIVLYEHGMLRILSDARHAVSGNLADVISQMELINEMYFSEQKIESLTTNRKDIREDFKNLKADVESVFSWFEQALATYSHPAQIDKRTLKLFLRDTMTASKRASESIIIKIDQRDSN